MEVMQPAMCLLSKRPRVFLRNVAIEWLGGGNKVW